MTTSIELQYPFAGSWLARNSPADRVPSHGTTRLASAYAIDFVPVDGSGRTAPFALDALLRPEPPQRFPGFGRPLFSPVASAVVATHDEAPDHHAYRGLPSLGYALTQRRRADAGWLALAGNHVLIESSGVVVAVCHLQRGSVTVRAGQFVHAGDPIGRCGNSGNSTEPHVHLQAMDDRDPEQAHAVPLTFAGGVPRNGEVITASASADGGIEL